MRRLIHPAGSAALLLTLSAAGLGMSAGPASAATCSGYGCHGFDPYASQCVDTKDAYKIASVNDPLDPRGVAVIHNKYSKGCNANWALAALTSEGYNDGDSLVVVITTTDSRGNLESMCSPGPSGTGKLNEYCYNYNYRGTGSAWTDMVDGTKVTQAYVYVYDLNGTLIASAEQDL